MKKYNTEKVLYFANSDGGLHISPDEPEYSDLSKIVNMLSKNGYIVLTASGTDGDYYQTTKAGDIRLLKLQIDWRERHGKSIEQHQRELQQLEGN